MKLIKISIAAATAATCLIATSAHALKTEDRILKPNYVVEYTKVPGEVESFTDMFTEGHVYGRIRASRYIWDYKNENLAGATPTTRNNSMNGVGGSFIYKTGSYHGFGATVGAYGITPLTEPNRTSTGPANFGRAGKDMYRTRPNGTEAPIGTFAEGYLEYKAGKTSVKAGRQLIESVMLATNDAKAIPNAFEAVLVENKNIPDTAVRFGYVTKQKLRDHEKFHSIGASAVGTSVDRLNLNDDGGSHRGLTLANISKSGNPDPRMILLTGENKSVKDLTLNGEYIGLAGFFATAIAEANYKVGLGAGWSLTPGVRYLRQMDGGAGNIGGASIKGNAASDANGGNATARSSYVNPNSVDGSIKMGRLVLANGPLAVMAGFSAVEDKADIIDRKSVV